MYRSKVGGKSYMSIGMRVVEIKGRFPSYKWEEMVQRVAL